jgi:hypothetical protein
MKKKENINSDKNGEALIDDAYWMGYESENIVFPSENESTGNNEYKEYTYIKKSTKSPQNSGDIPNNVALEIARYQPSPSMSSVSHYLSQLSHNCSQTLFIPTKKTPYKKVFLSTI